MDLISWRLGATIVARVSLRALVRALSPCRRGLWARRAWTRSCRAFQPVRVVLEVAFEVGDRALGHQPELVADAAQQAAIVRHHDHRAGEILQRGDQRMPHLEVEMVGGFVEQQQVGALGDQDGQRQARAFAAGEMHHRLEHRSPRKPKPPR